MSSIAWYATSGETVAPVEMIRSIHIRHLYLSHGHNYFGRHGMASDTNELSEVDEVECVAGRGLRGDRFFDYQENYKGQITFFSIEVLDAVIAAALRGFASARTSTISCRSSVLDGNG